MTCKYLTEQQVSDRFGVSRRTAQRWRISGDGPPFVRLGARRIAYREEDCEAWVAAQTHQHRAAEQSQANRRSYHKS